SLESTEPGRVPEQQAVPPDARVITDHDRSRGIDERHLHDLAVSADNQPRIRKLQAADEHLLVDLGPITDFDIGRVDHRCGADLYVRPDANRSSAHERKESHLRVSTDVDVRAEEHRPERETDTLVD